MRLKIEEATAIDLDDIILFLSDNELQTVDIRNSAVKLFVAKIDDELVGTIGIEQYNHCGLLRSFAVKNEYRNRNIGKQLIDYLFRFSETEQITRLYLLTTTAEKYFEKLAFTELDRLEVPPTIMQTNEFKNICPISASIMQYKF